MIYELHRKGDQLDASEGSSVRRYDTQGRLIAEEWLGSDGTYRDASEGPGYVAHSPDTGQVREEYYIDGEYRRAPHAPAAVTRDRAGNILSEEFRDDGNVHVKHAAPLEAEAGAHG